MKEDISDKIIQAAIEVHQLLGGPGLLENIYESALCHELSLRGLESKRQLPISVMYKNTEVRSPLYLDILVDNQLIVEVKATGKEYPFYQAQLFTYLRLMGIKRGLLINFGKKDVKDGIYRIFNDH